MPTYPEIKDKNCGKTEKITEIPNFISQNIGRPTKNRSMRHLYQKIRNFYIKISDLLAQQLPTHWSGPYEFI